jgi:hypothetical protein
VAKQCGVGNLAKRINVILVEPHVINVVAWLLLKGAHIQLASLLGQA